MAEVYAICYGIRLAKDVGFQKLLVESDYAVAISSIQLGSSGLSSTVGI